MEVFSLAQQAITAQRVRVLQFNALSELTILSNLLKALKIALSVQLDINARALECHLLLLVTMGTTVQKELIFLNPAHKGHMMTLEN